MMVIKARPRIVSHGFETFVPVQKVESLHQRLVEMTNNDLNAWNFLRPVATPSNGWEENIDDFNSEEFALHTQYPGYYQNTATVPQPQSNNWTKTPLYAAGHHGHCNSHNTISSAQSMHQGQATGLKCAEMRSPMLANGYSHSYLGQRHGSFAEFSNTRNGLKHFVYQNLNESDLNPFASALSTGQQSSYQEDISMMVDFNVGWTSPSTTHSGYSSASANVDPVSLIHANVSNHQNASMKGVWWPENSKSSQAQYQDDYGLDMLHDGLPRAQKQQQHQQYSDPWITGSVSSAGWTTQATATTPITISPKVLTLNFPPPPLSSSGSSQGLVLSLSESTSASGFREDSPNSIPEILSVVEPPAPVVLVRQNRQILPDSLPRSRVTPVLPSNDFPSRKTIHKRNLRSKSETHSPRKPGPASHVKNFVAPMPSKKVDLIPEKIMAPKRIVSKPMSVASSSDSSRTSPSEQAQHHRNANDDFLVKSKLAGMSYKDIRRHGNFVEAESTLRGRFRTLTKHKAARVRKPEWTDNDVRLLKKAVRNLTSGSDIAKNKMPWKLVAEYIANNGGSYHFGNATCRKRWDDLPTKQKY